MKLDHLAVAGETLPEAVDYVEEALGVKMLPGGRHEHFGTHNQLLGLADGLYLEAIAIDPVATAPDYARWFDLDRFSGSARLCNWICNVEDLDETLEGLKLDAGIPVSLSRGELRWRMAVPQDGVLPFHNLFPALIEWNVKVTPAELLPQSGCSLQRLEIFHPEADVLHAALRLEDAKVAFALGQAEIVATFDTPHGVRVLR
ncbi:VOC family protein [Shimia abyssi]|uniref:Glyoxalase-like protein n=1 Tax=Shimia abyssi TaxID=1662395 RepID=A0A2P8FK06_9RHOB|nr:VOC family protein [Shimia abyssi]PSL22057.1 glyoxalase-like protein [Shimia abyssi]